MRVTNMILFLALFGCKHPQSANLQDTAAAVATAAEKWLGCYVPMAGSEAERSRKRFCLVEDQGGAIKRVRSTQAGKQDVDDPWVYPVGMRNAKEMIYGGWDPVAKMSIKDATKTVSFALVEDDFISLQANTSRKNPDATWFLAKQWVMTINRITNDKQPPAKFWVGYQHLESRADGSTAPGGQEDYTPEKYVRE